MAMIHELLYQSKNLNNINLSNYIRNLVSKLYDTYGTDNKITPLLNVEDISVNIETAVPLGLIINELVSNSLKYAYPPDDTGDIFISLKKHDEEIEFILKDEGVGMPEDNSLKNSESGFGMELVNSLVQQLDAKMNLDRSQGTEFNIKFKELKYKKRI